MDGGSIIFHFEGDTSQLEKEVKKVDKKFNLKNFTSKIVGANIITGLLSKTFSVLERNMDGAIERFDTLTQFPKIMSNLGISTDDSTEAINKMSDKLLGLPTSLDAGARAVQRFTASNNDIAKSTDMFLALNNAILAGRAPAYIQANALEQVTQAYSKQKPDMREWRAMMMAMPAQMNQVAKSFGMSVGQLGEEMRKKDPTITMEQFMEKIVELNKTGVSGFASFEEQAQNATEGIKVSLTNLGISIKRGLANIFKTFNDIAKEKDLVNFSGIIKNLTKGINKTFEVVKYLMTNAPSISGKTDILGKYLNDMLVNVKANAPKYIKAGVEIVSNLIKGLLVSLPSLLEAGMVIVTELINAMADELPSLIDTFVHTLINLINTLFDNLPQLIEAGMKILKALIDGLLSALPELIKSLPQIISTIVDTIVESLPIILDAGIEIILALIDGLIEAIPLILEELPQIIDKIITGLLDCMPLLVDAGFKLLIGLAEGLIKAIPQLIKAIPQIVYNIGVAFLDLKWKMKETGQKILDHIWEGLKKVDNFITNVKGIGKQLIVGLWNGISNSVGWVISKIKGIGNTILKTIKKIFGIRSPSTEFEYIGIMNIKGMQKGLMRQKDSLQDTFDSIFDLSPNLYGTSSLNLNPVVNVTVNETFKQDPLGQMVKEIKNFSGGSKNDYNYGMGV